MSECFDAAKLSEALAIAFEGFGDSSGKKAPRLHRTRISRYSRAKRTLAMNPVVATHTCRPRKASQEAPLPRSPATSPPKKLNEATHTANPARKRTDKDATERADSEVPASSEH